MFVGTARNVSAMSPRGTSSSSGCETDGLVVIRFPRLFGAVCRRGAPRCRNDTEIGWVSTPAHVRLRLSSDRPWTVSRGRYDPAAESGPTRSPNPAQADHRFRFNPITDLYGRLPDCKDRFWCDRAGRLRLCIRPVWADVTACWP